MSRPDFADLLRRKAEYDAAFKKYPFWKGVYSHYSGEISIALGLFTAAMDYKLFRTLQHVAELDSKGKRRQRSVGTAEIDSLTRGYTDLYSFGNSTCMIVTADNHSLYHIPFDLSHEKEGVKLLSVDLLTLVKRQFYTAFKLTGIVEPEKLMVFPGFLWPKKDTVELAQLLKQGFPKTDIHVDAPGDYTVWLGNSPRDPSINLFAAYNTHRRKLLKNF